MIFFKQRNPLQMIKYPIILIFFSETPKQACMLLA